MNIFRTIRENLYLLIKDYPKKTNAACTREILRVTKSDVSLILSSSVVLKINHEGKNYYFRECERHYSIKRYVINFVNFYFDYLSKSSSAASEKEHILLALSNKNNFNSFLHIEEFVRSKGTTAPYWQFDFSSYTLFIGLDDGSGYTYSKAINEFGRYSIFMLQSYSLNHVFAFNNKWQSRESTTMLAYSKLQEIFGQGGLKLEYITLYIDGKKLFGTLMDEACGITASDANVRNYIPQKFLPIIQHELINLNTIDYVAVMVDHTPGNYNIYVNEDNNECTIQPFDIGEGNAFPVYKKEINFALGKISTIIDENGLINRPYFDKALFDRILSVRKKELQLVLKPYLNRFRINNVWYRIDALKKALTKTNDSRNDFLLDNNKWNNDTIVKECNGTYGMTYLGKLLEKCEIDISAL